jgi:hypothetical protein
LRADLEATLSELEKLDRKSVRQLRRKDYQTSLATLPAEDRVCAVLPVVLHDIRGPLVVTDRNLVFVSCATGTRLVDGLSNVHDTRFTQVVSGFSRRKSFDLTIEVGDNEVHFDATGTEKTLSWFAQAIEIGQELVGEPSTKSLPPSAD